MEDSLPMEHRRMFRFLHSSLAIVSLIWIAICLLIYFHAPSYQSQQVFDCRWYLSALVIQAVFGHIFIFCSNQKASTFSFCAALISTQYAIVYSMLTLIIYGMDTVVLMAAAKPTMLNYVPYLKLTAVLIVLSGFGLALSLVHMHRLVQVGRFLGANANLPALGGIRLYRAITGSQVFFALLSIYMAASLLPMKFWYVRLHMVQEFSCSLLAICLAILQFVIFRQAHGNGQFLLKAIIFANACQMVQELNMALSAFYTYFYVDRVYNVVEDRLGELNMMTDPHMQLAMARGRRAKTMLAMNLVLHICRMLANAFLLFHLANWVFAEALALRVKFKVDSALENVEQNWEKIKKKEIKWLYSIAGCVLVVGIAHLLLNFGYIWASMIFESLSVATGLSFVFSIALVISIGLYAYKMCRFFLILSAYISLNLLITACLLLFSFFQDFFFLATALDDDDENEMLRVNSTSTLMDSNSTDSLNTTTATIVEEEEENSALRVFLYFADFGLSLGTFVIAAFTIRYAIRTLVKTKLLQTQPANVQRAIRILRVLALVGLISSAIEIFMLGELRLGSRSKVTAHSSINTSFYDWLLSASQFLFLFYVCRYERFQALLPVQLLQLASVGVTTLDLIGQQTETVQIYVNNILQFYRLTEALLQKTSASSSAEGDHGGNGPNTIFITQPVAYTVPLHLFVDILALHFLQIIQWFLTIASLVIALYAFDNMVEDESDRLNDFHELRGGAVHGAAGGQNMARQSLEGSSAPTNSPLEMMPPIDPSNNGKMNSTTANSSSAMAFDNRIFMGGNNEAKLEE